MRVQQRRRDHIAQLIMRRGDHQAPAVFLCELGRQPLQIVGGAFGRDHLERDATPGEQCVMVLRDAIGSFDEMRVAIK